MAYAWEVSSNVQSSFHGVKLVTLSNAVQHHLVTIMGLDNQEFAISLRRIEIACAFVDILRNTPFEYVQAGGEPFVMINFQLYE
jgi:hypothetical protein